MNIKTKVFIYQLLSFAAFFIPLRFAISYFSSLEGVWIPFLAFIVTLIVAPKFQVVNTKEGSKIFMKWIFSKEIKEL